MLRRENILLLMGAVLILLGGALYLQAFPDEPAWAEWLLGPMSAFVGICVVIVGVAMRCYSGDSASDVSGKTTTAAKLGH